MTWPLALKNSRPGIVAPAMAQVTCRRTGKRSVEAEVHVQHALTIRRRAGPGSRPRVEHALIDLEALIERTGAGTLLPSFAEGRAEPAARPGDRQERLRHRAIAEQAFGAVGAPRQEQQIREQMAADHPPDATYRGGQEHGGTG